MTEKRFKIKQSHISEISCIFDNKKEFAFSSIGGDKNYMFCKALNSLNEENEKLKKDVEYWKQVASQYSNELNVCEHCRKYKTEYKDR